jgi:circadian clock protein KaiB
MKDREMSRIQLRLFVSGENPSHARVARGLGQVIARKFPDTCELQVIDVCQCPEQAEQDRILATPTLVRVAPLPACRVVGELAACRNTLAALGLRPGNNDPTLCLKPCKPI